ncbi:hypothetical protein AMECASPLE_013037 [Ameca splendens]|uniref:Uncharacterized protein n=1 Tax=Ameca splendens TaxID=208324 RepID=A0ABV0Y1G0_9TELE
MRAERRRRRCALRARSHMPHVAAINWPDSAGSSSRLTRWRQLDYGHLLSPCSILLQTVVRLRSINKFSNQTRCFMVVLFWCLNSRFYV